MIETIVIALQVVVIGILIKNVTELKKDLDSESKKNNNLMGVYSRNNIKLVNECKKLERDITILKASKAW